MQWDSADHSRVGIEARDMAAVPHDGHVGDLRRGWRGQLRGRRRWACRRRVRPLCAWAVGAGAAAGAEDWAGGGCALRHGGISACASGERRGEGGLASFRIRRLRAYFIVPHGVARQRLARLTMSESLEKAGLLYV